MRVFQRLNSIDRAKDKGTDERVYEVVYRGKISYHIKITKTILVFIWVDYSFSLDLDHQNNFAVFEVDMWIIDNLVNKYLLLNRKVNEFLLVQTE